MFGNGLVHGGDSNRPITSGNKTWVLARSSSSSSFFELQSSLWHPIHRRKNLREATVDAVKGFSCLVSSALRSMAEVEIELEGEQIQLDRRVEGEGEEEERNQAVLRLLDSMDGYLTLYSSLSSTLRQGWLDLASARHSMGTSRISYAMLDHKEHAASTSLQIISDGDEDSSGKQPRFQLRKWGSLDNESGSLEEQRWKEHKESGGTLKQRNRVGSQLHDETKSDNGALLDVDDRIKNERSKSLAVFGAMVSPKLRASQVSFEKAIETLVELANLRSEILAAANQVQRHSEVAKTEVD
ncbi:hypothetical protein LINGRAHAP2_LOCUS34070 [Linum grandiflorum]